MNHPQFAINCTKCHIYVHMSHFSNLTVLLFGAR